MVLAKMLEKEGAVGVKGNQNIANFYIINGLLSVVLLRA